MQKIRIGNDVRLNITLRGARTYNSANIKQLRCYLINTDYDDKHSCDTCKDKYSIHACGCPAYHVWPTHKRYKEDECPCREHAYPPVPLWGKPMRPVHPVHPIDPVCPDAPDWCKYLCPSKLGSAENSAIVYFPACDQLMTGTYKLVAVITTFEPGWGETNLRTYTVDYGTVIELVSDGSGVSGDIEIDVDTDTMANSKIISISADTVYLDQEQYLAVNALDAETKYYRIKVLLSNGCEVYYDPNNWPYEPLKFSSLATAYVSVNSATGALKASTTAREAMIVVSTNRADASTDVTTQYKVVVSANSVDYIGFATTAPGDAENLDLTKLTRVQDLTRPISVHNDADNQYLWIVTRKPIAVAAEANSNITGGYAVNIPLNDVEYVHGTGLFYYVCPNICKADATGVYSHIYVKYKE